jgi:MarR family transcriptional regulator, lower aerobic nicotinate degradation pathway regulator
LTQSPAKWAAPSGAGSNVPVHIIPTALARRFAQICSTAIAEAIAGHGLSPLQYGLLRHLDVEGPIYQNGLAGRLGTDQSNASILVEQIVTMGFVERHVDLADRRARVLRLTPHGARLVRRLRAKSQAANERILAPLDAAERRIFMILLARVIEQNPELDRPGAGRRKRSYARESKPELAR